MQCHAPLSTIALTVENLRLLRVIDARPPDRTEDSLAQEGGAESITLKTSHRNIPLDGTVRSLYCFDIVLSFLCSSLIPQVDCTL